MDKIKIVVTATNAVCVGSPVPLTTGMVGLLAEFTFSSEWDNLTKTAVCVGSGTTKDVLDVKDEIIVPHECLKDTAGHLKIGVYGVNSSGDLVIPTVYAYCGRLLQGADPSGDTSADPTLPIWAQLQAMIGSLDNLTTTARDNLVAAINEAAKSGGAAADVKMQVAGGYIQYSSDGGANWNNLIAVAELIGPTDETLTKSGKAADAAVVGNRLSALSEEIVSTAESKVSAHNTGVDTHSDIRLLIKGLTDRLNALADSDDTTLDQLSEVVAYIKSNRTLIEDITTSKVSVADIIDNLTTNVSNKPLSAAQGVALKAMIDAISIPDKLPNPNALTFTGAAKGTYDGSAPLSVEIPSGGGGSGSPDTPELVYQHTCDGTYVSVTDELPLEDWKIYLIRITVPTGTAQSTFRCMIGGEGNTYSGACVGNIINQHSVAKKQTHATIMKIPNDIVGISYFGANIPESTGYTLGLNKYLGDKIYFYSASSDVNIPEGTTLEVYTLN